MIIMFAKQHMEDKPREEGLSLASTSEDENHLNNSDITSQRVGRIENQLFWKELSSEEETAQVMMMLSGSCFTSGPIIALGIRVHANLG